MILSVNWCVIMITATQTSHLYNTVTNIEGVKNWLYLLKTWKWTWKIRIVGSCVWLTFSAAQDQIEHCHFTHLLERLSHFILLMTHLQQCIHCFKTGMLFLLLLLKEQDDHQIKEHVHKKKCINLYWSWWWWRHKIRLLTMCFIIMPRTPECDVFTRKGQQAHTYKLNNVVH